MSTQETFQRGLTVTVIWHRDVRQRQINFETALCISTLKFTTLKNVQSTLSISTLILTTLDNVEAMLLFSTSSFITLINVETTLWIWPFSRSWKEQKNIFELQKKKMSHLVNNTCFRLWSIKRKEKHGTYNVKINFGKYNTWKEYENNSMSCWWQNKLMQVIAPLVYITYMLLRFLRFHIVKKQHMYFSLYFLFPLFHIVL